MNTKNIEEAEVISEEVKQAAKNVEFEKSSINGVECEGFSLVAKTSVGLFLLGDDIHGIQQLPTKEIIAGAFEDIAIRINDDATQQARKDWDELHLICIHTPAKMEDIKAFASGIIKWQNVYLPSPILGFQGVGLMVSEDILKFKAFDLHDDIIAQVGLEKRGEA